MITLEFTNLIKIDVLEISKGKHPTVTFRVRVPDNEEIHTLCVGDVLRPNFKVALGVNDEVS